MASLNITKSNTLIILSIIILLCELWLVECLPPPHPRVLEVREEENNLPHYFRSPALHNPHLRHILPLTSLLHHGEKPVYRRPSDEVSRESIVAMLTHAGFRRRQPQFNNQHNNFIQHHQIPSFDLFNDPPSFPSQDLLQHL